MLLSRDNLHLPVQSVLSEAIAVLDIACVRVRADATHPCGLWCSFRGFIFGAAGPLTHGASLV